MTAAVENVIKQASNAYVGTDRRARQHQLAAAEWSLLHRVLSTTAAVLAAVSGASLLADGRGSWRIVAGLLGLLGAASAAANAALDGSERAREQKEAADAFTQLRRQYMLLRNRARDNNAAANEIVEAHEALIRQHGDVETAQPQPPRHCVDRVNRRVERQKKEAERERNANDA